MDAARSLVTRVMAAMPGGHAGARRLRSRLGQRRLCETLGDATQHAELIALRAAFATVGEGRLPGAVVYCSLEPCFMCAGAILHVRASGDDPTLTLPQISRTPAEVRDRVLLRLRAVQARLSEG